MPSISDFMALTPEQLVYTALVPALIIFAIFWGILESMKLFGRKVNFVLALSMTIATAFSPVFSWISYYVINLASLVGVGTFGIVLIVGIIIWGLKRGLDMYYEFDPYKKLEMLERKRAEVAEKKRNIGDDPKKQRELTEQYNNLTDEINEIRMRLGLKMKT